MSFLMWWTIALLAWVMVELDLRMWARPERHVAGWSWSWPAPARALVPLGPEHRPAAPRVTVEYLSADGRPVVIDPVHVGATEEWSPRRAAADATARMLPLDDVDEWLAGRLSAYEHALVHIGSCRRAPDGSRADFRTLIDQAPNGTCTVDEEMRRFVDGSQALHAYRELRIGATGEFTPRQAMQLEALLSA